MSGPQSEPPKLPGFSYTGWLGSGGFADVFSYNQDDLDREVAVKVLLNDLPPEAAKLFASEINLMAKLSSHPSIVSVFQAGMAADGRPFLVMEVCPPPTLRGRLRSRPFDVPKTLEIGVQIASAVETAHRLGMTHRDIKPSNILFTEYGRAALTDFGISIPSLSVPGAETAFSVAWAPPEQIRNQLVGPPADIYSLAATLWAMLTGRSPFESETGENSYEAIQNRNLNDPIPPLNRTDVPESLEWALRRAMDKDPAKRQPSALDFARQLQQVQTELGLPATTIDVRVDANRRKRAAEAEAAYEGTRVASFERSGKEGGTGGTGGSGGSSTGGTQNSSGAHTLAQAPVFDAQADGKAQFWLPLSQGSQPSWWREGTGWPSARPPAYPPATVGPGIAAGPGATNWPAPAGAPRTQPGDAMGGLSQPVRQLPGSAGTPPPLILESEERPEMNPLTRNIMIAILGFLVLVLLLVVLL